MADKHIYTAFTFSPVQGFIEKSRKLRDLYGASLILSYLSQQIVKAVHNSENVSVVSPALINIQRGMPNRILIKGEFKEDVARKVLLDAWKDILFVCKNWIEDKLKDFDYEWEREWKHWGNHTWEIFWGTGSGNTEAEGIIAAMDNLETRKLERAWTAINWIGESSSLTGTDGIAFPALGSKDRKPKNLKFGSEKDEIENFYDKLASITEGIQERFEDDDSTEEDSEKDNYVEEDPEEDNPEGKFIALKEQLSIPELVKRLVTLDEIREDISKRRNDYLSFAKLPRGFKEIQRKPTATTPGQWTGWFMGDGDEVGKKLKKIAREQGEQGIQEFTYALRDWGKNFYNNFYKETKLGRVIYAGGDDFLGVIYNKNPNKPIQALVAFDWLMTLQKKWSEHKQDINLSVGFVWVAGSVPQRDVLQHCRDAEKRAKNLKRNRVTIRIVFNSGQYVEWTCPWDYLHILKDYCDRDNNTYYEWECNGRKDQYKPNWSHVYGDLTQLKARHAFGLSENRRRLIVNDNTVNAGQIIDNRRAFLDFFDMYFPNWGKTLRENEKLLVGASDDASPAQKAKLMIRWVENLITVGWHLCSNISSSFER